MSIPVKPDYSSIDLPLPPRDRPYVLVNMVMSADGKAAIEGSERGIGSPTDQRLMRELRANADIVLNGAGTLRLSGASPRLNDAALEERRRSRGRPRFPTAAVLSRSGDLPLDAAFFTARDFDAVVYLSSAAPSRRRRAIAAGGRPVYAVPAGDEVPAMLRHMRRELGAGVLLLEGGPALNQEFFARGAVDEFFLTLAPLIVGGRDTITVVEGAAAFPRESVPRLDLLSAVPNPATGEVYLRYRVR